MRSQVEIISKPRAEYQTDEYSKLNLPKAPAIMVNDEVVVEGSDVDEGETRKCHSIPSRNAAVRNRKERGLWTVVGPFSAGPDSRRGSSCRPLGIL